VSEPYVGEIRLVGFNFAPNGWAFCNGALLAISEFDVLFNLIGTTYGGDGQNTFGLPNLQGRIAYHQGPGFVIGQIAGEESIALTSGQLPTHSHPAQATGNPGSTTTPAGNTWASWGDTPFGAAGSNVTMSSQAISSVGGNLPHENRPPFLVLNYVISLFGIFPSPN
jgi:microcystin-dependent protein